MSAEAPKRWSQEDYLDFERQSDTKHEYFDGEIFAMAGAKRLHNLIAANVVREAGNGLKLRTCEVYGSDMKVECPTGLVTYPDISIMCGKAEMKDDQDDVLLNPIVIVEVLSKSTESYDRGRKFENYKTIPSLKEYILIAQDKVAIDHFALQANGKWNETTHNDPAGMLELPALECSIAVEEIYRGVAL